MARTMEQYRGAGSRVPAPGPAEDQAPGPALRAWQSPDRNRVPRDSDFRPVYAAAIELDGNRLGDRHLRLSVRIGRISGMGFAGNVAPRDPDDPRVRGALAQKSGGSNPAASDLHLCVSRLDYFLCGTYRC